MKLKEKAKIKGLKPEIVFALMSIQEVFKAWKVPLVVTEITGGRHGINSLHYTGYAVDIRTKHIKESGIKTKLVQAIQEDLGEDFDIILEDEDKPNEHLHVEFDPKG